MADHLIDRNRAAALMQAAGIDALVLFQPEHVTWSTGVNPGPAALFRRAGAASVLIPADPATGMAAVLPDLSVGAVRAAGLTLEVAHHPIWVDTAVVQPHGTEDSLMVVLDQTSRAGRPTTFDARTAFDRLAEQLRSRGLDTARLGIDLGFVPAADLPVLQEALPMATLVDSTDVARRLRMVKSPAEVERLQTAADLSVKGLTAALKAVRPLVERQELTEAYADGVRAAAAAQGAAISGLWDYISIGPDPWGAGRPAQAGDILKFDVGVVISGYSSDMARTVVLGTPSRAAIDLHCALLAGLEAGLDRLKPGVRLSDVYQTIMTTVRNAGVGGYARGHFGHGLGNDPFSEQWPFIAADSEVIAEPGMVLAVEAPHYVEGLGGFIIEDQVLVTETGIEIMTPMLREFTRY